MNILSVCPVDVCDVYQLSRCGLEAADLIEIDASRFFNPLGEGLHTSDLRILNEIIYDLKMIKPVKFALRMRAGVDMSQGSEQQEKELNYASVVLSTVYFDYFEFTQRSVFGQGWGKISSQMYVNPDIEYIPCCTFNVDTLAQSGSPDKLEAFKNEWKVQLEFLKGVPLPLSGHPELHLPIVADVVCDTFEGLNLLWQAAEKGLLEGAGQIRIGGQFSSFGAFFASRMNNKSGWVWSSRAEAELVDSVSGAGALFDSHPDAEVGIYAISDSILYPHLGADRANKALYKMSGKLRYAQVPGSNIQELLDFFLTGLGGAVKSLIVPYCHAAKLAKAISGQPRVEYVAPEESHSQAIAVTKTKDGGLLIDNTCYWHRVVFPRLRVIPEKESRPIEIMIVGAEDTAFINTIVAEFTTFKENRKDIRITFVRYDRDTQPFSEALSVDSSVNFVPFDANTLAKIEADMIVTSLFHPDAIDARQWLKKSTDATGGEKYSALIENLNYSKAKVFIETSPSSEQIKISQEMCEKLGGVKWFSSQDIVKTEFDRCALVADALGGLSTKQIPTKSGDKDAKKRTKK